MRALHLVLCALAAQLPRAGRAAEPAGPEGTVERRPATIAATWVGASSPDATFAATAGEPDWWVLDVCRGATVAVDVSAAADGIVEAVLLDSGLSELARVRASGSGGRLHWIAAFDGRVFVRVGPAGDSGASRVEYRMWTWWVDALTCPGRAAASPPSAADTPSTSAPPPPPPLPGTAGATTTPASPRSFARATPEQPSPPRDAAAPGGLWTTSASAGVPGVPSDEPTVVLPPGVQQHDGFLWRLALGLGYAGAYAADRDYWTGRVSHEWESLVGGGLNMAFGGSVDESWYLYFDFNTNFPQLFAFGAGFGVYLEDNWFLDGTIGYQVPVDGYVAVTAGKEWWVGEQWLTGLSVRWMGSTGSTAMNVDWTTSVTLNWSLTYN